MALSSLFFFSCIFFFFFFKSMQTALRLPRCSLECQCDRALSPRTHLSCSNLMKYVARNHHITRRRWWKENTLNKKRSILTCDMWKKLSNYITCVELRRYQNIHSIHSLRTDIIYFIFFFSIRNLVSDFNGVGRVKSQTIELHTIFQELQYLIKFFLVSIEDKINESHSTLQIHLCVASLYSIPFWILTAFDLF